MTDEGRRETAAGELAVAKEELEVARGLLAAGHFRVAVARAYFAAFHAARARLYVAGVEPKTHAGVQTLWNTQFVKTGVYSAETGRALARLQRYRELADYAMDFVVDEEGARDDVAAASDLVELVRSAVEAF